MLLSEHEIDAHVSTLLRNGFVIVENSIPADLLERLQAPLKAQEERRKRRSTTTRGSAPAQQQKRKVGYDASRPATRIMSGHWSHEPAQWDLATAPNILRIAKRLLGDDCLLSSAGCGSLGDGVVRACRAHALVRSVLWHSFRSIQSSVLDVCCSESVQLGRRGGSGE